MAEPSISGPTGVINTNVVPGASPTDGNEEKSLGDDRGAADDEMNSQRATEDGEIKGERIMDGKGRGVDGGDTTDCTIAPELKKKGREKPKAVSFIQLFKYADKLDKILLLLGTMGAIGNGASQPVVTILFGSLINAFGNNVNDRKELIAAVAGVSIVQPLSPLSTFVEYSRQYSRHIVA